MRSLVLLMLLLGGCRGAFAQNDTTNKIADSTDRVFYKVEVESEFPGGIPAWTRYLEARLVYPPKAVQDHIEGTVILQFIVDKTGHIYDLKALSGDPVLQEAALRVMRGSPKWKPAVQNGRVVKSYKKQPIVFRFGPGQ
ncbi:MAG TPA: energy transducer TonB [Puia sp.]|jgi:protein TonB|nr:energy transducer TonB [Puia sp.]